MDSTRCHDQPVCEAGLTKDLYLVLLFYLITQSGPSPINSMPPNIYSEGSFCRTMSFKITLSGAENCRNASKHCLNRCSSAHFTVARRCEIAQRMSRRFVRMMLKRNEDCYATITRPHPLASLRLADRASGQPQGVHDTLTLGGLFTSAIPTSEALSLPGLIGLRVHSVLQSCTDVKQRTALDFHRPADDSLAGHTGDRWVAPRSSYKPEVTWDPRHVCPKTIAILFQAGFLFCQDYQVIDDCHHQDNTQVQQNPCHDCRSNQHKDKPYPLGVAGQAIRPGDHGLIGRCVSEAM